MGDWYEIKELGGKLYLEFQSEATGWNMKVIELSEKDRELIEEFEGRIHEQRRSFLQGIANQGKGE